MNTNDWFTKNEIAALVDRVKIEAVEFQKGGDLLTVSLFSLVSTRGAVEFLSESRQLAEIHNDEWLRLVSRGHCRLCSAITE